MSRVREMLRSHPQSSHFDNERYGECIGACFDCAQICSACADACLGEENPSMLAECIRTDLDCADVCLTTGRMLLRMASEESEAMRLQLEACEAMCRCCAEECERHASHHEHCRICGEVCRECEQICQGMHGALASA